MSIASDPTDLLRTLLSGSGSTLPVPEGMGDLRARILKAAYAPYKSPGIVPEPFADTREKIKPLELKPLAIATPKLEPEAMFATPSGWKDNRDEAIRKAKEALDKANAAGAPTTPAVPEKATAPTPEPHQFEGQYTVNPNAPKDQAAFYAMVRPQAEKVAAATGLDVNLVMAKIGLETGFGKHAPGFNYFGIKETDPTKGQVLTTQESVGGKMVTQPARFRTYGSLDESVADYVKLLQNNPRYAELLKAKGIDAQLAALQASGYATDPNYAAKIKAIMGGIPSVVANAGPAYARGGPIGDLLALSRNYR